MPLPLRPRLSKPLLRLPWRRIATLAGISLVLAVALTGFLFELSDHFFTRLFTAFFVVFWLLAVTFLGVVPFVTWATGHWFGRSWQEGTGRAVALRRPIAPIRSVTPVAATPQRTSHR